MVLKWVHVGFRVGSEWVHFGPRVGPHWFQDWFDLGSHWVSTWAQKRFRLEGSTWADCAHIVFRVCLVGFSARLVPGVQAWFNVWLILGLIWVQLCFMLGSSWGLKCFTLGSDWVQVRCQVVSIPDWGSEWVQMWFKLGSG